MPGTFGGHENRAGSAKGCQHIGNAVIHQGSRGTCSQLGARLQLFPVLGAGQLCQLLRIRLNQRRLYLPRNGGDQRRLRGIDGDLALISAGAQLCTQFGVICCIQAARQRTGEHHPIRNLCLGDHERIQGVAQLRGELGTGGVKLSGRAVRINHGDIRADRLTRGQIRKLHTARRKGGQHGVGSLSRNHRNSRHLRSM